jgi:CheY-like chemotaxis protein
MNNPRWYQNEGTILKLKMESVEQNVKKNSSSRWWGRYQYRELEQNSFIVNSYEDPFLALENFKPNFYDLLILDIKMPEMSGF